MKSSRALLVFCLLAGFFANLNCQDTTKPDTTAETTDVPSKEAVTTPIATPDDDTTTTTEKPTSTPTTSTTSSTSTSSTTTTITTTTTTPAPTTTPPSTTTAAPNTTTTTTTTQAPPVPVPCHRFDGPSFIGGIVLTLGLLAIGLVAYKFYKARNDRNYHTL